MNSTTPRLLLIDDHVAVRRGLTEILAVSFPGAEFGHSADARQAATEVRAARWDLVILDLNLPGSGGTDLIRALKDEQPRLRILVYSMHPEEQFGVRALRAGADGYLAKDAPAEEIPKAVRTVLGGERYISARLAAILAQTVTGESRPSHHLLSDREDQILRAIAAGKSAAEIAGELSISTKTVSTYRSRILEKLNLRTNADLIRYAIENQLG
jgi:two-component system invasion response regulator UvrY